MVTLIIAPHPDDEVIGCGGIIAKRVAQGNYVYVCIAAEGTHQMYGKELVEEVHKQALDAHKLLGVLETMFLNLPSVMLDEVPQHQINGMLQDIIDMVKPDEVYIPHRGDIHRDHQIIADSAMVAVRPCSEHRISRILAYETISETDWNIPNVQNAFIPNVYEDISEYLDRKCEAMVCYESQLKIFPSARSILGIRSLALHRGAVANMEAAEAFMLIREVHK